MNFHKKMIAIEKQITFLQQLKKGFFICFVVGWFDWMVDVI